MSKLDEERARLLLGGGEDLEKHLQNLRQGYAAAWTAAEVLLVEWCAEALWNYHDRWKRARQGGASR